MAVVDDARTALRHHILIDPLPITIYRLGIRILFPYPVILLVVLLLFAEFVVGLQVWPIFRLIGGVPLVGHRASDTLLLSSELSVGLLLPVAALLLESTFLSLLLLAADLADDLIY